MGKIAQSRTIARFDMGGFETFPDEPGLLWRNVSFDEESGQGSYLMIFEPGAVSAPHRHEGPEEWFMVEGDLIDHDGFEYNAGDFVSLAAGSAHESVSLSGCKIVVTHRGMFTPVNESELEAEP